MNNSRKLPALMLVLTILAGCASELAVRQFDQGKQLLAEGKTEQGLAQLEQATREDPKNMEYRIYLFRQREAEIVRLLTQADSARSADRLDEAAETYNRVLGLDAANQRAKEGLNELQAVRRHKVQLADAQALFDKGDLEGAQSRLIVILTEDPGSAGARALQQRVNDKNAEKRNSTALKTAIKKPITLEFREADLRSIFEVISRTAGINFIIDKEIRPDLRATIFVRNTTIEDAIRLLLVTNQLEQKVLNDNTILIYPNTPAKAKDYQELVVKSFYLTNGDVKQTLNMLKTILKLRDVFIEESLGLLVIRDTPESVHLAEKLIATQDLASPEVVLEVEVLEVGSNRLTNLGIQYPDKVSASLGNKGTYTLEQWKNRGSDFVTLHVTDPALVANLKVQDSDTKLLANPRIRVKNREKAKVHIGERLPVITTIATANVGTSETVTYLDIGLKLEVEPIVRRDEVDMKVGLEVSNLLETITRSSGTQTYRLGTRNTFTTLRLKDGETQVLAGLIQEDERKSAHKVPALGEVPILGRLFSSHSRDDTKTEIVLLMTPHVVRNLNRPDAVASEFVSGTEATISTRSLGLRSAGVMPQVMPPVPPMAPPPAPMNPAPGSVPYPVPMQVPVPVQPPAPTQAPAPIQAPAPLVPPTPPASMPSSSSGGDATPDSNPGPTGAAAQDDGDRPGMLSGLRLTREFLTPAGLNE